MRRRLVQQALAFARDRHAGQTRKGDGSPFITHPVAVARILRRYRMPAEVVAAGLLHDVLEDTDTRPEELRSRFGARVANLVERVTEPAKRQPWELRKRAYVAHLRGAPRGALAISCADKIHNTASLIAAYRRDGPAALDRFSRGIHARLAYHRKVSEAVRRAWADCPLLPELDRQIRRMEGVAAEVLAREPREVEAKLRARTPSALRAVGRLRSLGPFRLSRQSRELQKNVYLDTADLRLRRARAALKLRTIQRLGARGEKGRETAVGTFKSEVAYRGGVSERVEVKVPVPPRQVSRFLRGELEIGPIRRARRITGSRPLREVLTLRTARRRLLFADGRERIELALDRVSVQRGGRTAATFQEVEVENLSSPEEKFREALAWLRRRFRRELFLSRLPKVEVGFRLLRRYRELRRRGEGSGRP